MEDLYNMHVNPWNIMQDPYNLHVEPWSVMQTYMIYM